MFVIGLKLIIHTYKINQNFQIVQSKENVLAVKNSGYDFFQLNL